MKLMQPTRRPVNVKIFIIQKIARVRSFVLKSKGLRIFRISTVVLSVFAYHIYIYKAYSIDGGAFLSSFIYLL